MSLLQEPSAQNTVFCGYDMKLRFFGGKLLFWVLLLFSCYPALACSCMGQTSAKDAWRKSPVVFLGWVEQTTPNYDGEESIGKQTVLARVDVPFKGSKVGQAFTLEQPGDNCTPKFKVGERVLFYLESTGKVDVFHAKGCHRTRDYTRAADDLLFLNRLPESAAGNRLSGLVSLYEQGPKNHYTESALVGVKVTATPLVGPPLITATNGDGVYEWNNLPVGQYAVEIEAPRGKRKVFSLKPLYGYSSEEARQRANVKGDVVHIGADTGVHVDYWLEADTKVIGTVLDPQGKPMEDVLVGIRRVSSDANAPLLTWKETKAGKFMFEMVPPGQYYLVLNSDGRTRAREPFPTLFYPGTEDFSKAVAVTVPDGGTVENLEFRVPSVRKTIELTGRVLFSDGMAV